MKTDGVIGLGRFGTAVATELCRLGHEVLAIDGAEDRVQAIADQVTHAVTGDARDPAVLRALGVRNYDCAIVAMADDVGTSALITMSLKEMGVKKVIAKAQGWEVAPGADYVLQQSDVVVTLGRNDDIGRLHDL